MATAIPATPARTQRDHAVELARKGLKVFPLPPNTKLPRDPEFYNVASDDHNVVHVMWSDPNDWPQPYNIGVLMGGGFAAIDVDVKDGKPGLASLAALDLPADTMIVKTPTGGLHYLFRTPRDVANGVGKNDDSPLGHGIDIRGHRGYVVGVGSTIDGVPYVVENDAPLAELPQHVLDRLAAPRERQERAVGPATDLDTDFAIARATKYLRDEAPAAIEGDGGDATTFRVALAVKDMGVSADTALDLMAEFYNGRCAPAWDLDELKQKVDNAFNYGVAAEGARSPVVDMAGVDTLPPKYIAPPPRAGLKWADDPGSDQPIQWLLKGLLPRNGVGIVYGAPKSGKSFVAFDLSARLANAMPWFNIRTPKEPVGPLLLLGEGSGTVRTRLSAFRRANAGAKVPPMAWETVAGLSTAQGMADARAIIADAAAGMAQRGVRLGLIVVDTLASALGLEDENSAPQVTAALKALEALASEFDVAVLGIHHAGKNGQDRGSSAFRAACDVMMQIEKSPAVPGQPDNYRKISVDLNRNGEGDWAANFKLDRVVLGIDEDGDEITSCVVRPSGATPIDLDRREIVMGQFDPRTIHNEGFRLPGDRFGLTRAVLTRRCMDIWDVQKEAAKSGVKRAVAELLKAGRLQEVVEAGGQYLVAVEQRIGGDIAPADLF